uniref:Ckap2 n=1 Tax=Eyprepocnemis plorans TaxID=34655 RepID=A0A1W5LU03_9ORTH|nr:ckap2 [Eyprepocnemis plorans]
MSAAMRFATTGHNKENKQHENKQIKNVAVNKRCIKNANDEITKKGPAVHENGGRMKVTENASQPLTDQKDLKLQVAKWRAERQARLAAKIIKKQGKNEVPPAVLGISGYNVSLDITGNTTNSTIKSKDDKKPGPQKNVKSTINAKRKPVEVRQTTASRLRMEKANPLLTIGKCTGLTSTFKVKTPASSLARSTNITRKPVTEITSAAPKQLFKVPKRNEKKYGGGQLQRKCSVQTVKKTPSTFTPVNRIKNVNANMSGVAKLPQSTQKNKPQISASDRQKNFSKTNQHTRLRRSSSATTFHPQVSSLQAKTERSPSVPDISRVSAIDHSSAYKSAGRPSRRDTCVGVSDTPLRSSLRKSRMTLFSTPQMKTPLKTVSFTPQPDVLRRNLLKWLEKRGKSLNEFGHLRCFGLHKSASDKLGSCAKKVASTSKVQEEEKQSEFAETASKESLANDDQEVKERIEDDGDVFDNCNLEDLKHILSDLHKLILATYPREQCEEWLHVIRRKFPNLDDEPLYWECLAALEEARGDYTTAIDFYSRAIVSGAEAEVIDKSLDLLWQKFTSLKLQSRDKEVDNKKQKTPRRSVDPCQVFKSSIIKFALQQKAVKQLSADLGVEPKSLHYVATPVRRSTRKSNNPYKSSSVVCVGSLNTLQPDVRDSVVFVSNTALTPKV